MITYKTDNELSLFNMFTESSLSNDGSDDRIVLVKNYVASLDIDAAQLSAEDCSNVRGFTVFLLGGILEVIRDNGWFKAYGYPSFKAMPSRSSAGRSCSFPPGESGARWPCTM